MCVEGESPHVLWWQAVLASWQFWTAAILLASIVVVRRVRRAPSSAPPPVDRWREPR